MQKTNGMSDFKLPEKLAPIVVGDYVLRLMKMADAEAIFAIRSDEETMKYMGVKPLKNMEEAQNWIKTCLREHEQNLAITWVITHPTEVQALGYCTLWQINAKNNFAQLGYALQRHHTGKGIMLKVLPIIVDLAFNRLGFHRLEANLDKHNLASEKLIQKLGFQKEALLRENYYFDGEYIDSLIYGLLATDR